MRALAVVTPWLTPAIAIAHRPEHRERDLRNTPAPRAAAILDDPVTHAAGNDEREDGKGSIGSVGGEAADDATVGAVGSAAAGLVVDGAAGSVVDGAAGSVVGGMVEVGAGSVVKGSAAGVGGPVDDVSADTAGGAVMTAAVRVVVMALRVLFLM